MSDKIDQRIVEMSFENEKFEKGILKSKNSLSEFNNALKNTAKGDFSGLDNSVKDMSRSFSAFQEVAVGALRRIGSEAVAAGANLVKAIAIDPITQGFTEMELKMNSTQTIMASTGESLAVVNSYLQELNEYSDKTIYSFSDMTQNIGKFTNAGVKLDAAVASIKGISNAAALAGANSNEASRAMYNFAQALSSGYVKLLDWKSIELANMATVEFKQELLDSAVAAGTLAKTADGMYKVLSTDGSGKTMDQTISATRNFNESLAYQWMTTEALTGTLARYSDETTEIGKRAAQAATQVTTFTKLMDTLKESVGSGWSQTFEIIFGDFNEARDLWTGMNSTLGAMIGTLADARNILLSGGLGSGWKQLMDAGVGNTGDFENTLAVVAGEAGLAIDELVKDAGSLEKAVKGNWVTGNMLVETISRMSSGIENLSEEELRNANYTEKTRAQLLSLRDALKSGALSADDFATKMGKMSGRENIIQGLKNSVIALLTAIKPVSQAFDQIFPPMTVARLYEMTETFKNFTGQLIIGEETANNIKRTFAGLFAVIDIGWQGVKFLGNSVLAVVQAFLPLGDGVLGATASLGDFLVMINQFIKSSGVLQYGLLGVRVAMALVRGMLADTVGKIAEFVHGLWTAEDPLAYLRATGEKTFGGILSTVKMVVTWVSDKFTKAIKGAQGVVDSQFGKGVKTIFSEILDILKGIVEYIAGEGTAGFESFGEAIKNLDFRKIATFVTGGVILLFVKQLTDLTSAMTGLTKSVTGVVTNFSKKFLTPPTNNIRDISTAIGILTASIWVLSTIPAEELTKSLVGLAGAVGIFVAAYAGIAAVNVIASKVMKDQEMVSSAFNLVGIAAALAIMAGALKTISKIDKATVWDSVTILTMMLGFVTAYQALSALISKIPGQQKTTMNLVGMSAGILSLIGALAILNAFSITDLQTGIGKMAVVMLILGGVQQVFAIAARLGGGNKLSTSLLSMAAGIAAMVGVMKLLSVLDSRAITGGIGNLALMALVMGGIEVVMGLAARVGGGKKLQSNMLSTQLGMLAMVALVAVISMLDQSDINKGLATIAAMGGIIGAIEILTAAAARIGGGNKVQKILGSVTITMLAFAGVIALLDTFDQSTIDRGLLNMVKMSGLIVAIETLTALASKISGDAKVFGPMLGITVAILTVTSALALLSMIDQESLRNASVSLAVASSAVVALSAAVSIMMKAIKAMGADGKSISANFKALLPGLTTMLVVLVATGAFFLALKPLMSAFESVSWDSLAKITTGLTLVSAMVVAFSRLPLGPGAFDPKSLLNLIPGFAAMAAVLASASLFFGVMAAMQSVFNSVSWDNLAKMTAGIVLVAGLILAFAALSGPLAAAGSLSGPMLAGVGTALVALIAVVAAFAGLAAVMSTFDMTALRNGIESLVLVGEGIGRFVGSLVGGLATEALTGIGEGIAGFIDALSGFTPDSLTGIKALAEAILIMTGAAVVDGISRFVNLGRSPAEVFGSQLKGLVEALKGISAADASAASDVLAAMAPMAENLKAFASAAKDIPNSGGVLGAYLGDNDVDTFGTMLSSFVGNFASIPVSAAKHSAEVLAELTPMADNLKTFATAASSIPNSGGFLGDFMGNNDIDTFGSMLSRFVGIFSDDEGGISEGRANKAKMVLGAMAPMAKNLKDFADAASDIPNSGGFLGAFFGTVDVATFSEQLHALVTTFGTIDEIATLAAITNLQFMADKMLPALIKFSDFSNGLENSGGLAQLFSGNTTLSEFGDEFASFVKKMAKVDFSVVGPAMDSLATVTASFENIGAEVLSNAKKSFENNKEPFQAAMSSILDSPIKNINSKKDDLSDSVNEAFASVEKSGRSYVKSFEALGKDVIEGLKKGVNSKKPSAIDAVKNVMTSIVTTAKRTVDSNSPSRVFATIGGWCTQGLAVGLEKETDVAVKAGENMAKATEEGVRDTLGVHSPSKLFSDIGNWIPKSLGDGIQNGSNWLLSKAQELGIDTSNFTVDGLVSGLYGGEGMVTSGIASLLDAMNGSTSIDTAASGAGTSMGDSVTSSFQSALSDSETGLGGSGTKAVVKSALDQLKEYIDEENFYGRMSLEEELAKYEALRSAYREGSAERKAIDREVYRLMKSIYEAQLSYIDEVQAAEKDAADQRLKLEEEYNKNVESARAESAEKLAELNQKYDKDVISAKESADQKIQDQEKQHYNELNNLLDQAEADRQRTREQYAENQKAINSKLLSDIDAQNKAYENAVKSRADTIYNSYNLFAAVEPDEDVSGDTLLQNLRDQGAALSEWEQSLNALAERGIGEQLVEELQAMGPASKAQIKALLTLTDEQLTEYVSLYEGKYAFARKKAEIELEGLKESTTQAIKDLNAQAAIDLDALEAEFNLAMTSIDTTMAADMAALRATHQEGLDEIHLDLSNKLAELESEWNLSSSEIEADLVDKLNDLDSAYNESLSQINTDVAKKLEELKSKFSSTMKDVNGLTEAEMRKLIAENKTKLTQLNTDTGEKLEEVEKTFDKSGDKIVSNFATDLKNLNSQTGTTLSSLAGAVKSSLNAAVSEFEIAGDNAAAGFANGIHNGAYRAISAAEYLARQAVTAAERILDEHSPSKVFEGIGQYVSQGFANGITDYAHQAERASQEMANGPIAAVSKALAELDDTMSGDSDWSPVITPVLDLSNIKSSALAGLLTTPVNLGAASSRMANAAVQNGSQPSTTAQSIINKFEIRELNVRSESDIDAIATKLQQKQDTALRGRGGRSTIRRN